MNKYTYYTCIISITYMFQHEVLYGPNNHYFSSISTNHYYVAIKHYSSKMNDNTSIFQSIINIYTVHINNQLFRCFSRSRLSRFSVPNLNRKDKYSDNKCRLVYKLRLQDPANSNIPLSSVLGLSKLVCELGDPNRKWP